MRLHHLAFLFASVLLWTGPAAAKVELRFTDPKAYTDGTLRDFSSARAREETYKALHKVFEDLAERYLPEGQALAVDVTELDLAGRFEPWRVDFHDVRFMRSVTWPRMTFSYAVHQDGTVITSGTADISDMNYLHRAGRSFDSDRLRYERQMLSDWFSETFVRSKAADASIE